MKKVGTCIERIGRVYELLFGYPEVDTEFALDESNRLFMLQSRPVVEVAREEIKTIDFKKLSKDRVICSGSYSLLGAVVGKAKVRRVFKQPPCSCGAGPSSLPDEKGLPPTD